MKTEKKLELLKEIRLENRKNRQLMEERQRILGIPVYSVSEEPFDLKKADPHPHKFFGLRLRICGALLLLGGFIVLQRMDFQYREIDAGRIMDEITRTISIEQLIHDGRVVLIHEETGVK